MACLARLWMTHSDDGVDPVIALLGERAPDRDRLGAHRAAAPIGLEVDAGHHTAVARADGRADLLPVGAITRLDRLHGGGDQFLVLVAQRFTHGATSRAPSARGE